MLKNKPSGASETVTFFSGKVIPQKEKKKTIDSAFLSVVQQLLKKRHLKHPYRPNVSALRLLVL